MFFILLVPSNAKPPFLKLITVKEDLTMAHC